MNQHVDKAMELRNEMPMVNNCAQTIMRVYGLMVLGAMGIDSPKVVGEYRKRMAGMHDGLTDCAALLQENARKGGEKKVHCDNMIKESIELIDELTENK